MLEKLDIRYFDEVDSTNTVARDMARSGAPDGAVIVARRQTAGRGRLGRVWFSHSDFGLWFSAILKPDFPAQQAGLLGIAASVAVARALLDTAGVVTAVKWPNDVLIAGKKVAGILPEAAIEGGRFLWAIVGMGVNLFPPDGGFPDELEEVATYVSAHATKPVERNAVLSCVLQNLAELCRSIRADGGTTVTREAASMSCVLGRSVRVTQPGGAVPVQGRAISINRRGELRVKMANGTFVDVSAGEVSLRLSGNTADGGVCPSGEVE
ncbi:MAG: biotin--[acetyl-CoA-carboxylase] ligase [Firmicutes bacterium]|jgi:BirA family biotin operon repressor/biotin-[acetyl-CoA-carboxylase] ligase|nr:biotin--[acetyl-CoA-carboxylase] ligase [Bacillota bacterium]